MKAVDLSSFAAWIMWEMLLDEPKRDAAPPDEKPEPSDVKPPPQSK